MYLQPFYLPPGVAPVCLFDVDDVVANLSQLLRPALNFSTRTNLSLNDWTEYDLSKLYPMSFEDILDLVARQRLLERAEPVAGTVHWIRHLHAHGIQIHFATARGFHPRGQAVTEEWMRRHDVPYHSVIVTRLGESKIDACQHLGRIALMVDDHDRHLDTAEASNRVDQLILVDKPWNRHRLDYQYQAGQTKQRVGALSRSSPELAASRAAGLSLAS